MTARCWEPGTSYNQGDKVVYQGKTYKIIQPHTSQSGWEPTQTPALWGACHDEQVGQQQQQQESQDRGWFSQKPADQQPQQQQGEEEGEEKKEGFSSGMKIAAGVLGGAAALGLGALAYNQYNKHQENKQQTAWAGGNWETEAQQRLQQYNSAAVKPKVAWVLTTGNEVPANAIPGGAEKDGEPLYIARAFIEHGVHIGKIGRHMTNANIPYGGKEVSVSTYEVLVGDQNAVRWVDRSGALVTDGLNLVEGGREPNGSPLYIAQAAYKGGVHPGKAGAAFKKGAMIPYGGDEEHVLNYRVLTLA
ncbi:hypothetical protein HK102_003665 [Quaeritorhiza haematococci]|nr:hypothetical protein HK102_003665 [Quaeritorhiza haematococci]